jgi:WXG100 family type VII secretion target
MASDGNLFSVDLAALSDAISQVSGGRDALQGGIQSLRSTFTDVETLWQSPAGKTFTELVTHFNSVTDNLMDVLGEAIDRMHVAYENYASTEQTNTSNLLLRTAGPGTPHTAAAGTGKVLRSRPVPGKALSAPVPGKVLRSMPVPEDLLRIEPVT